MTQDVIKQAAFITGRILHQGTGEPVVGRVRIAVREGSVVDKVLADGTFAVSGDLEKLFPQSYPRTLTIRADSAQFRQGFVEYSLPIPIISMGSNFDPEPPILPDLPINLGTIRLPVDPAIDPTADPVVFQENMQVNIRGRVVRATDPDIPINGATVSILQSSVMTHSTTTNFQGRYRFDNIIVRAPAQIECSAPGFQSQTPRILQIDFGKLIHEGYFRLTPP
jgi:Carboxypeptidase regulatory-like domain